MYVISCASGKKWSKKIKTYFHYLGRAKDFVAHRAFLPLSSLVDGQMLVKVGLLGETLITTGLFAFEWPLSSVNPEMIKEIMPLSEEHVAPTMVTL